MKHRRGIDLAPFPPASFREFEGYDHDTVRLLKEWEVLGARCGKCKKKTSLDKKAIIDRYGDLHLKFMASKLVCACGNRDGNQVLVGRMARD